MLKAAHGSCISQKGSQLTNDPDPFPLTALRPTAPTFYSAPRSLPARCCCCRPSMARCADYCKLAHQQRYQLLLYYTASKSAARLACLALLASCSMQRARRRCAWRLHMSSWLPSTTCALTCIHIDTSATFAGGRARGSGGCHAAGAQGGVPAVQLLPQRAGTCGA